MFNSITLKNYRTHIDTTLSLGKVTLLLGNNNSGKTNLLNGIRHFSQLIGRANPEKEQPRQTVWYKDFYPHRHRLSNHNLPLVFSCNWTDVDGDVDYSIELTENQSLPEKVSVKECIDIRLAPDVDPEIAPSIGSVSLSTGQNGQLDKIILREEMLKSQKPFTNKHREISKRFFRDLAQAFAYHFQPSYLKGQVPVNWPVVDPNHLERSNKTGLGGSR